MRCIHGHFMQLFLVSHAAIGSVFPTAVYTVVKGCQSYARVWGLPGMSLSRRGSAVCPCTTRSTTAPAGSILR